MAPTSKPSAERHRRKHRLLRHVLGLGVVAQHAPGDGEHARQMPVDEGAERGRVSTAGGGHQLGVLPRVWPARASPVRTGLDPLCRHR